MKAKNNDIGTLFLKQGKVLGLTQQELREKVAVIMSTQESRFEFLVDFITTKVVEFLMRDDNLSLEEALLTFHNSETFEALTNIETELYIQSPGYVYAILKDEFNKGSLKNVIF